MSHEIRSHLHEYIVEDNKGMKEGYAAALGFSALMGLGTGPRAMQTLLAGGAILAAASPFLKKDHETTGTEKLTQSALTLAAWARIHSSFNVAKRIIDEKKGLHLDLIARSKQNPISPTYRSSRIAEHSHLGNGVNLWEGFKGTTIELHEGVHANWTKRRLSIFGPVAEMNARLYYDTSDWAKQGLSARLTWQKAAMEAFTDMMAVLKTPLQATNQKVTGAILCTTSGLAQAIIAAVCMLPLAYLMQQASNTIKAMRGSNA